MTATSSFSFQVRAFMRAVAVSTAVITSSVLTGGVLQRDGIMQAEAASSMTAAASVNQAASVSMSATSSMTVNAGDGVISFLSPLTGLSSNRAYGTASVALEPLTSSSLGSLVTPYYAYATSELTPLLGDGYMLTGQIGQVSVSLQPLAGLSGNYSYGEARSYLQPLTGYSYDLGPPEIGPGGIRIYTVYMSEILGMSDSVASEGSEFNATMDSSLQASSTMDRTLQTDGDIGSTLNVSDSITLSATYTVEYTDTLSISSDLGGNDTYIAWVTNENTKAASMYEGFNFDSLALFAGRYMAAGPSGIFELTGATDNGVPIVATVRMGKTDFGDPMQKRIHRAYFGVYSAGDMTVTFTTDDGRTYSYPVVANSGLQSRRVRVGGGLKSRYWTVELSNPSGTDFTLESDELIPTSLTRRIR